MSDNVLEGLRPQRGRRRRDALRLAATQLPAWPADASGAGRRPERRQWVELTYSELISDVESVSAHLADLGLRRGDVLCMLLPNWTEAVIYTYAAARLGAVICPITTIYRQRELSFILERTACKVIVIPPSTGALTTPRWCVSWQADYPT